MTKHGSLIGCRDFLPKPKRKYDTLLAQCPSCQRIYVCRYSGGMYGIYLWYPLNEN